MAINYTKTNWVNGQAPAISAANLNKIEQGIKDSADAIDEIVVSGTFIEQKKLLWTNSSPTSNFAAQTVTISGLSDYDAVEIDSADYIIGGKLLFCADGTHEFAQLVTDSSTYAAELTSRTVAVNFSAGTIVFNDAKTEYADWAASGVPVTNNTTCKPYHIYGIKNL